MKILKLSWGYKILLLYLGFVTMVIVFVVRSMNERVDLVASDYYDKEIKYQEQFDMMQNSNSLSVPVEMFVDKEIGSLVIAFPVNLLTTVPSGVIRFIKPDDASKDFQVNVATNASMVQQIPVGKLDRGVWNIEMTWHSGGNVYFDKERIVLK